MQEAFLILAPIIFPVTVVSATSSRLGVSLPGCPDKCGNVSIPYPFGIGAHCAATNLNRYFALTCNDSSQPPKPLFGDTGIAVEVIDISLEHGEVRVYGGVSYNCFTSNTTVSDYNMARLVLDDTPFILSTTRNRFTVIGCNTLGIIVGNKQSSYDPYVTGCYSYCQGINGTPEGCSMHWDRMLRDHHILQSHRLWSQFVQHKQCVVIQPMLLCNACRASEGRILSGTLGSYRKEPIKVSRSSMTGQLEIAPVQSTGQNHLQIMHVLSSNSYCVNASNEQGYLCNCSKGYEGNPYLPEGCQDINECELRKKEVKYKELYPCENGRCHNTQGGYICKCRVGTISDGTNSACQPVLRQAEKVVVGLSASAVVMISLAFLFVMKLQERKHRKEKEEYFKKIEKEIKKDTNNFSEDCVLRCGGHGMVYKGTLDDNNEVAIKKSKVIDEDCREEFVNEIIILSHIKHRHIVRLLGRFLVVDVPMLLIPLYSDCHAFERNPIIYPHKDTAIASGHHNS
ncbi:hypothetical protein U9M48_037479 [Paspalum notatum var. saurae]|uniref:Protein kinase domain-containing protein n=1 Tax=Paspalum notatum var. saurae TaxID=547442 RepID=A0AAQ3UF33_PASNO